VFQVFFNLISSDPVERMVRDAPLDKITAGANLGAQRAAEYVLGDLQLNAPWRTGQLSNAQEIWATRRIHSIDRRSGVIASRKIAVLPSKMDRYYALAQEYGWKGDPDGQPWMRETLHQAAPTTLEIYRDSLTSTLKRGRP